jgi:hypothetical protein
MKSDEREKSLVAADIASGAKTDRRIIYQRNHSKLLDLCLQSHELLTQDAERIVSALATHLTHCTGETDEEFIQWASTILKPAIERIVTFYAILNEHKTIIHAAIWDTLGHHAEPNRFDDDAALEQELFQDVCIKILDKLDGLKRPGKAKLSTRIYALTKWQVREYLKAQRTRHAAIMRRLAQGRGFVAETLSDAEIAEMRSIEREQMTA